MTEGQCRRYWLVWPCGRTVSKRPVVVDPNPWTGWQQRLRWNLLFIICCQIERSSSSVFQIRQPLAPGERDPRANLRRASTAHAVSFGSVSLRSLHDVHHRVRGTTELEFVARRHSSFPSTESGKSEMRSHEEAKLVRRAAQLRDALQDSGQDLRVTHGDRQLVVQRVVVPVHL